ncbi:MAG TPA: hypothetical protein DDY25_03250, partial [Peptococcaceae bacterium]|nr:hypothetical protein [Peptococcaceae bacterium]
MVRNWSKIIKKGRGETPLPFSCQFTSLYPLRDHHIITDKKLSYLLNGFFFVIITLRDELGWAEFSLHHNIPVLITTIGSNRGHQQVFMFPKLI